MADRDAIIGAWDLAICEVVSEGAVSYPLGDDAVGILTYAASGTMSLAIMRAHRERFSASDILLGSEAERAAACAGYMSFSGRWGLAGNCMIHRIEVSLLPNWEGDVQKRRVSLERGLLTLASDPIQLGERTAVARTTWCRRA